jgi:hypothetical protein
VASERTPPDARGNREMLLGALKLAIPRLQAIPEDQREDRRLSGQSRDAPTSEPSLSRLLQWLFFGPRRDGLSSRREYVRFPPRARTRRGGDFGAVRRRNGRGVHERGFASRRARRRFCDFTGDRAEP